MTKAELSAEHVISLIRQHSGNVAACARALGISRPSLYNYINEKPTVKQALDESRETMLDNVESALYRAALAGEAWAVCFFLKTQGKSRGYVERSEITGADSGPVTLKVVYGKEGNGGA